MNDILIVGGGHVGVTLAVDLQLRNGETGFSPRIALMRAVDHPMVQRRDDFTIRVEDILTGRNSLCVFPRENIHNFTEISPELLAHSSAVVVTVPDVAALRRRILDRICASPLADGATIIFVRGGQGGLLSLIHRWRTDGRFRRFNVILVEDSFYGTRYINHAIAFKRKRVTNVSAFGPSPATSLNLLKSVFAGPSVEPVFHEFSLVRPLDMQFDALGYIIHLGVALDRSNVELTRRNVQYLHYCEGVHSGNADRLEALDRERVQLSKAYGGEARAFPQILQAQYGLPEVSLFLEMMKSTRAIYRSLSEKSLDDLRVSRLIQEDVPALMTMEWLAENSGEHFPLIRAHVAEVRSMLDELRVKTTGLNDYRKELEAWNLQRVEIVALLSNPSHVDANKATAGSSLH